MKKATLLPPSLCCCEEEGDDKSRRRYKNKSCPPSPPPPPLLSINQLVVMVFHACPSVCVYMHACMRVCARVYIMRRTPSIINSSALSASLPYCVLRHGLQSLCHMHYLRHTHTPTLMQELFIWDMLTYRLV